MTAAEAVSVEVKAAAFEVLRSKPTRELKTAVESKVSSEAVSVEVKALLLAKAEFEVLRSKATWEPLDCSRINRRLHRS